MPGAASGAIGAMFGPGMDASLPLRYAEERQTLEQWISTWTVLGRPVEKAKAGGWLDGGWDAGSGWGYETRGMKRGVGDPGMGR